MAKGTKRYWETDPTIHQPLMAWETVADGMGCIHCFTKEVYRKTWVTGKRLYLVRETDVLTPMSYCECLLEQKGLHEIDMKPPVCVWSVVCVCVCLSCCLNDSWNDTWSSCTMHRELSTQVLVWCSEWCVAISQAAHVHDLILPYYLVWVWLCVYNKWCWCSSRARSH